MTLHPDLLALLPDELQVLAQRKGPLARVWLTPADLTAFAVGVAKLCKEAHRGHVAYPEAVRIDNLAATWQDGAA